MYILITYMSNFISAILFSNSIYMQYFLAYFYSCLCLIQFLFHKESI